MMPNYLSASHVCVDYDDDLNDYLGMGPNLERRLCATRKLLVCTLSLSLRGPGIESGKSRSLFPLSCLRTNNIVGREGEGGEGDGESC